MRRSAPRGPDQDLRAAPKGLRRINVGMPRAPRKRASAADLKFLHRLRQTHFRNFKSKSGTRIVNLLVPLLLPKFVSEGAAMYHELRKRGTSAPRCGRCQAQGASSCERFPPPDS